jgi:hypothetical protein
MKSIFETLAALGAGAILLTGCGSAPVNAKEVPAASSKPAAAAAPVETKSDGATAGATEAKPEEKPADNAAATPAPSAAPAAKKTGKVKKPGAKKGGADANCGEGTCG